MAFTVAETVIALSVSSLVVLGVMLFFRGVMINAKGGSAQCRYLSEARRAQQQITSYVREGKAIGVVSNRILILLKTDGVAAIEYVDSDSNPSTVTNNTIRYDPDVWLSGDESDICT
jgi:type II secretory pathway component PulJ